VSSPRHKLPSLPRDLRALCSDDTLVLSFAIRSAGARAPLTPSEAEVLLDVVARRSNAEITDRRGRRARTIANQVATILRKLGVSSRLELVAGLPLER
jgi:DNA-binding CsgD family transcriptional regulator